MVGREPYVDEFDNGSLTNYLTTLTVILVIKLIPKLSILMLLINIQIIQQLSNVYMLTLMLNFCRNNEKKKNCKHSQKYRNFTNFLVWKFCRKAQFWHSFGKIAQNYAETFFPQNIRTRKLGEITVFFAVKFI